MENLWNGITDVITNLVKLIETMSKGLLGNEIFQIIIGIIIFGIVIGTIFTLVKKLKNGYTQMDNAIGHNFSAETRKRYVRKAYIHSLFHK